MKAGLSETWREYSRSMTGDNALRLVEKLSLMNFSNSEFKFNFTLREKG